MNLPVPPVTRAWVSMGEALLIGLLIGAQREAHSEERHAGLRDFLLVALAGGMCGLLHQAWITVTALAGVVVFVSVFRWQTPSRTGVTTELATIAAFLLAYLTALHDIPYGAPLAIGLTIVVVFFLEAKRKLEVLVTERITEAEFNDTLRFLAVVLVIYPILPAGAFGPYHFFDPRKVWLFLILVSSISYAGYFMEKFMGASRGLRYTAVLGGLASTTAATSAFAKDCAEDPAQMRRYAQAAVLANAIQFPRVLMLITALNPALARSAAPALLAMTAAGVGWSWFLARRAARHEAAGPSQMRLGNPFRFLPALKFALLFAGILLLSRWAAAEFGSQALFWVSILGGSMDLDAVVVSFSDLVGAAKTDPATALWAILAAMAANALVKTAIAFSSGLREFGRRLLFAFLVMFAAGALVLAATRLA
jgi:uncharacterized membrane protein (DUF4010 family)